MLDGSEHHLRLVTDGGVPAADEVDTQPIDVSAAAWVVGSMLRGSTRIEVVSFSPTTQVSAWRAKNAVPAGSSMGTNSLMPSAARTPKAMLQHHR